MNHDPSRRFPSFRETETAVADTSAGRAHPLFLQQGFPDVFPVAIQEARTAKLPTDATTIDVVADRFGVGGLLSALVASGTVYTVVDLFCGPDGHFVDFPFFAHRFLVQCYFDRLVIITMSPFSAGRGRRERRERREGGRER